MIQRMMEKRLRCLFSFKSPLNHCIIHVRTWRFNIIRLVFSMDLHQVEKMFQTTVAEIIVTEPRLSCCMNRHRASSQSLSTGSLLENVRDASSASHVLVETKNVLQAVIVHYCQYALQQLTIHV